MKKILTYTLLIIFSLITDVQSQDYNKDAFLKDYSGDLIITTQVREKEIKQFCEELKLRKIEFVLKNYTGIQPSIYPAWDGGFVKRPLSLEDFKIKTKYFDELVNWGVENDFHIMHHCLIFPNKFSSLVFKN